MSWWVYLLLAVLFILFVWVMLFFFCMRQCFKVMDEQEQWIMIKKMIERSREE